MMVEIINCHHEKQTYRNNLIRSTHSLLATELFALVLKNIF